MSVEKFVGICLFAMVFLFVLCFILAIISAATGWDDLGWAAVWLLAAALVPGAVAIAVAGVDYIKNH